MKLLDRLPIPDRPHLISVGTDAVQVHRNQIIVWISINYALRPFPAILDTGHGHNLSICEGQLARWSGASAAIGSVSAAQPVRATSDTTRRAMVRLIA